MPEPTPETGTTPGYTSTDWAGESAQRWVRHADGLEAQLEPISTLLFDAAALQTGERVLDVGCGRGATTRDAADRVGGDGQVVGIDVATPLLDQARASCTLGTVEWVAADAQRHTFAVSDFDVVISRFGVMFFDDSTEAFANLRAAVKPDGRLAMVVWQPRDRSPLFDLPLSIARQTAAEIGWLVDDSLLAPTGGPFAFGDTQWLTAMLTDAGWTSIVCTPVTLPLYNGGPGTVEDALAVTVEVGPLRIALASADDDQRREVLARIADAYAAHHDGVGVRLDGSVLVVTAAA